MMNESSSVALKNCRNRNCTRLTRSLYGCSFGRYCLWSMMLLKRASVETLCERHHECTLGEICWARTLKNRPSAFARTACRCKRLTTRFMCSEDGNSWYLARYANKVFVTSELANLLLERQYKEGRWVGFTDQLEAFERQPHFLHFFLLISSYLFIFYVLNSFLLCGA